LHAARVGCVVLVLEVAVEEEPDDVVVVVDEDGEPPPQAASSNVKAPSVPTMARRIGEKCGRIMADPQ